MKKRISEKFAAIFVLCAMMFYPASALAAEVGAAPVYNDIDMSGEYGGAVKFVSERELMNGITEGVFAPEGTLTRAMMVVILHRFLGSPEYKTFNDFVDVKDNMWYTPSVIWAAENKIVEGYGNGRFGPDDPVTRSQLFTILHRFITGKKLSASDFDEAVKAAENGALGLADILEERKGDVSEWFLGPVSQQVSAAGEPARRIEVAEAMRIMVECFGEKDLLRQSEERKTVITYSTDEAAYGSISVDAELVFHYTDAEDEKMPMQNVKVFGGGLVKGDTPVELHLFRNYPVIEGEPDDVDKLLSRYLDRDDFNGMSVWIKTVTYGRNVRYDGYQIKINDGYYDKSFLSENNDCFSGNIDFAINDELIAADCVNGKFIGNVSISLVFVPRKSSGE